MGTWKTFLVHGPLVGRYCPTKPIAELAKDVANAAYAAGVQAERERTSGWIPVGERLPEAHVNVLCYTKGGGIVRDRYDGITLSDGTHQFHGDREEWRFDVTHWMPLPPPPSTTPNDQER